MEESVKILQHIIMQADPILTEIVSKVKQFERYTKAKYQGGNGKNNNIADLDHQPQENLA